MRFEIVDKKQTIYDVLQGKISMEDIGVVNFGRGEIWGISEIVLGDLDDEKIIFIRKFYE
jgi:hypothetical protein